MRVERAMGIARLHTRGAGTEVLAPFVLHFWDSPQIAALEAVKVRSLVS